MDEAASHALAEDPSIFEYDSLYDQMVEDKKKKCQKLSSERKVSTTTLHSPLYSASSLIYTFTDLLCTYI